MALDTLDIVNPDLYVTDGYPHDAWTTLRAHAPVYATVSSRSGR